MSTPEADQDPDVQDGIEYWNTQSADYDGVLGELVPPSSISRILILSCPLSLRPRWLWHRCEFLSHTHPRPLTPPQSLPRVDALGSRQFLQHLRPDLCTVPSAIRPLSLPPPSHRTRAVDVGAGVGRVTSDVLLHLVQDVVLLEPVESFVQEALRRATASARPGAPGAPADEPRWKGLASGEKSVTLVRGTLQAFDPARPFAGDGTTVLARVGYTPPPASADAKAEEDGGFDVVWCQWCLGHLSDADLVAFFRRCRAALREPRNSVVVVKENLCRDGKDGAPRAVFDESDSSLTRFVLSSALDAICSSGGVLGQTRRGRRPSHEQV
jgi:protein N-terminal methyltransferase